MTAPAAPDPPCDLANDLLTGGPSRITGAVVDTDDGQRFMLTLRTTSATLTVFLTRQEAREWGQHIVQMAATMNGLLVPKAMIRGKGRG